MAAAYSNVVIVVYVVIPGQCFIYDHTKIFTSMWP